MINTRCQVSGGEQAIAERLGQHVVAGQQCFQAVVSNRDISGSDFAWALDRTMENQRYPEQMMVFERREWGNFYGYLEAVKKEGVIVARGDEAPAQLTKLMARVVRIHDEIYDIEKGAIGSINYGIERLRLQERGLELDGVIAPQKYAEISAKRAGFDAEYADLQARLKSLYEAFNRDSLIAHTVDGRQIEISLGKVVRFYQPNQMSLLDKVAFYGAKIWEFISDEGIGRINTPVIFLIPPSSSDGPYLQAGLGVQTWFCDPQSPWQKGTVENTNRRARRWLSRDVDPVDRRSAAPTALRPSQRHASQVSGLQNALGSVPAEAPGPPSMNRLACSGCKVALRRELTRRCWAAATSIRRLLASPWR